MVIVVRAAVMVCSLLLALPQGWCCILATFVPKATPTSTVYVSNGTSDTADGCCPCRLPKPQPTGGPTEKPNSPAAPKNTVCPCIDRHATVPETTAVEQADAGFVLYFRLHPVLAPGVAQRAAVAETGLPPPSPRTHVWNCVWRC